MTPTIVFKDGQPWLATGSPGGSLIITTVLQTLLNAMVFDMNIAAAVAAPRVHNQWMPERTLVDAASASTPSGFWRRGAITSHRPNALSAAPTH
jgi:gamma-glutamyltranspeptidase/glutathione hydrolase